MHTRLFTDLGDNAFTDAFENAYALGASPFDLRMNNDYHLAYLIAHIAHHFKFYGAGLRMILDLAVILNTTKIDISRVLDILSKINLDTFAREILGVCFRWFSLGRDFGRNVTKTEEYLLKCGAFGSLTENTGAIVARKDLEDGKSISSPLLTKMRLAFPSYNRMKNIPYIRFIEGRPWLTPYAWCYRFFYNFKNRGRFVVHTVKSIDDKDTQALAAAELKYFEEIGLWHF